MPLHLRRLMGSTLSARGTDLIDEMNQVWVGWWIFEVVTALRLLVASTADAAETRDASRTLCMDILVLEAALTTAGSGRAPILAAWLARSHATTTFLRRS
jgi:hypothetical protein